MTRDADASRGPAPIACRLDAFDVVERRRYDAVRAQLLARVCAVEERESGYRLSLDADASTPALAGEWIALEQRCCPFFEFTLESSAASGTTLTVSGPPGAKEILRPAFAGRA